MRERAILACLVSVLGGCADIVEEHYSNYESANASGAMKRGWVPSWLPASAHNLNEAHSIDTNQSLLHFEFESAEWEGIQHECVSIAHSAVRKPGIEAQWWPRALPQGAFSANRLVYYSCDNGAAFLAVNSGEGHAYYWRP